MALHQFANDFFELLGSNKNISDLEAQLKEELCSRWGRDSGTVCIFVVQFLSHLSFKSDCCITQCIGGQF
jgi:hypothetical protein